MHRPYTLTIATLTVDGKIDTVERRGAAVLSPDDRQRVAWMLAAADPEMVSGRTRVPTDPRPLPAASSRLDKCCGQRMSESAPD